MSTLSRLLWLMMQRRWHDLLMLPQVWREHRAHTAWHRRVDRLERKLQALGFDEVTESQRAENRWRNEIQREWRKA